MKKVIVPCLMLMGAIVANAQTVQFGLRAGLNIAGESDHTYPVYVSTGQKYRAGLNVGGIMNLALSQKFEVETDVLYSMQGYKDVVYTTHVEQNLGETNYSVTSHYLNIPIAAKYYIVDGFYVECGPQVGYLLSKKDDLEGWETENDYDSSRTKNVDFSLLAGLGYRFPNHVFIDARYTHGFTDTSKLYDGGRNRNFQISLGYLF